MDTPAASAASQLAWDHGSWRTIEIRSRHDFTMHDQAKEAAFNGIEEHYIETRQGQRYHDQKYLKGDTFVRRMTNYCDGSKSAAVQFKDRDAEVQTALIIKRDFGSEDKGGKVDRPVPLLFAFVGKVPLHEALPKSTHLGKDRVAGRDCDNFLFEKVKWFFPQDQVFSLDATSRAPLKVTAFSDQEHRASDTPVWIWTADKVETVQGHAVVTRSTEVAFKDAGKTPTSTRTFTVQSIRFDEEFPASTFWPVVQPGVSVLDAIQKKRYETPGVRTPAATSVPAGEPLVATPPRDWTQVASWSTLGLGLAVLLAGVLIWRRRR